GLLPPALSEADEKPLVSSEPFTNCVRLPVQRQTIRIVCRRQTGEIGNVLAQSLVTVYCKIRKRPVLIILGGKRLTRCFKVLKIFLCPPVGKPPFGIELAALIVKAVTDLVPDDCAHRAVVMRRVRGRIEEWRLKDRRRKIQRILKWQVHRVYGLWG